MNSLVYTDIVNRVKKGERLFALLIDPDKTTNLNETLKKAIDHEVDYFFVGGSLLTSTNLESCVRLIKKKTKIPVVLFPGDFQHISPLANAILFLTLISGRNAELLIGKHVTSAPSIKASKLEVISTGYMLIDGGRQTSASYISGTNPIPYDKDEIAMCTAMAGEMLGMKIIYADAGSGAITPVSETMISRIKNNISIPLIVGGGIRSFEDARKVYEAGADIVVVGTAVETKVGALKDIAKAAKHRIL